MKLSIVIPAYNEQEAIASTVERCLAARESIVAESPVDNVEIIVVSDGSTDRTAEIAAGFDDVRLIVFEQNRGYGAAIKRGFNEATGEIVGFLDADGTCNPVFFGELCRSLVSEHAAVAIGSRMGPQSRMPRIRRIGNRIYAFILSALSNHVVTDTASGMRVIRREVLPQLYPLPDGLHFTPAMSARVLMDDQLTIIERPMAYEERIGESKLHVIRDGVRFLRTIFEMSLMWQPVRMFHGLAAVCLAIMVLLAMHPLESWLRMGRFDEDRIYRLLFCSWLGSVGLAALSAGLICDQLQRLLRQHNRSRSFALNVLDRLYSWGGLGAVTVPVAGALALLVARGWWTRLTAGYVDLHWSRVVLAGLIAFGWCQMLVTVFVANVIRFHIARRATMMETIVDRESVAASCLLSTPTVMPPTPATAGNLTMSVMS